jgi:hypothetical protein
MKTATVERSIPRHSPQRSPERERLANALVRRAAAEMALEAGRRAITRAGDILRKCETRVEAAREALAAAGAGRAAEFAAAEADVPAATGIVSAARIGLADAQDELDAAQAAHAKLQANLPDLLDDARNAGNVVTVCVDTLLRSHAALILEQAEDAVAALASARCLLRFMCTPELTAADSLGSPWRPMPLSEDWNQARQQYGEERASRRAADLHRARRERDDAFAETNTAIGRFLSRESVVENAWNRHPDVAPWQAARAALMDDADAPLPTL